MGFYTKNKNPLVDPLRSPAVFCAHKEAESPKKNSGPQQCGPPEPKWMFYSAGRISRTVSWFPSTVKRTSKPAKEKP